MAEITRTGIETTELGSYVQSLEESFRAALGEDLSLETATPQGQLIGALALILTQVDELVLHVASGMSLHTAVGRQLGDYGTLFSLPRIAGEYSTVTAALSGTPGTVIPIGTRARTTDGAVFATASRVVIGNTMTVDVLMRSAEIGPVVAPAGELTRIVDTVPGWSGVSNAAAAEVGRNAETDAEYRRRYVNEIAVHGLDDLESIRARVLNAANVTDCLVRDNSTAAEVTVQNVAIGAYSLLVIVRGGADEDIAAAIAATKPIGVPTIGTTLVQVAHPRGFNIPIRFLRVSTIPVTITVNITLGAGFPSTGFATMRQNLLQWFAGTWPVPGPGIFDQSGVGIGEIIDLRRLNTPLNAVPGHSVNTVTITRVGGVALGTPDLNELYTLASDNIMFTTS